MRPQTNSKLKKINYFPAAHWSSRASTPETYPGKKPFSGASVPLLILSEFRLSPTERETQIFRKAATKCKPDVFLSVHSGIFSFIFHFRSNSRALFRHSGNVHAMGVQSSRGFGKWKEYEVGLFVLICCLSVSNILQINVYLHKFVMNCVKMQIELHLHKFVLTCVASGAVQLKLSWARFWTSAAWMIFIWLAFSWSSKYAILFFSDASWKLWMMSFASVLQAGCWIMFNWGNEENWIFQIFQTGPAGERVGYRSPGTCLDFVYEFLEVPFAYAFEVLVVELNLQGSCAAARERQLEFISTNSRFMPRLPNAKNFFKCGNWKKVSTTPSATSRGSRGSEFGFWKRGSKWRCSPTKKLTQAVVLWFVFIFVLVFISTLSVNAAFPSSHLQQFNPTEGEDFRETLMNWSEVTEQFWNYF